MIEISELRPIDIPKYRKIFEKVNSIYDSFVGTYYKLIIKGVEYILHRGETCFTLFNLQDNTSEIYSVDKDLNIQGMIIDGKSFRYYDDELIARSMKTGISENLSMVKRDNGEDVDGYNGLAIHVQYDSKSDTRVIHTYQHMYNSEERIYPMHLRKPFTVAIERNASKADNGEIRPQSESYIKDDYDLRDEPIGFSIATIKDYGLIPFMQKGSYSLQKKDKITRYYKVLGKHKDCSAITLFPFCRQYKIEDINDYLKELGFETEVSETLLDVYNRDDERLLLFKEILETIKANEKDDTQALGYKIAE